MPQYTIAEKTAMLLVLGEARGNQRDAARIYAERYPNRRHPRPSTIWRVHNTLMSYGSFRKPSVATEEMAQKRQDREELVLATMYANPHASSAAVARDLGMSKTTVLRILKKYAFHPFRIHLHQALHVDDSLRRVAFCLFLREHIQNDPDFCRHVVFSDESTFHRDGTVNRHNLHYWSQTNPFWLREDTHQVRWKVNVWCGIFDDRIIGPYFFDRPLTGAVYLDFLRGTLSEEFFDTLPLAVRGRLWFQQDGAPPHNSNAVTVWLNQQFGRQWMGNTGPLPWPARSPDLTPMDYFLWGFLKAHVYDTCPPTRDVLQDRIRAAVSLITPAMLKAVRENLVERLDECIAQGGGHFEQFR